MKKMTKRFIIGLSIGIVVILLVLGFLWNKYLNKYNLLSLYTKGTKEVYVLGTMHTDHFNRFYNYSMEDIISVIKSVGPDALYIEARKDIFDTYGVVDGPIDMAVAYSYAINHNIPVKMIDWWEVDNNYIANSTNDKRDDMMFDNIQTNINSETGNKVLVLCGNGHYYAQESRFVTSGYDVTKIEDKDTYFKNQNTVFQYPDGVEDVWTKRAYFYAYTYPDIVSKMDINDEVKNKFISGNHDKFYNEQLTYIGLFNGNQLYK